MIVLIIAFLLSTLYALVARKRRKQQKEEGYFSVVLSGKPLVVLYLVCTICVGFACFMLEEVAYVPYAIGLIAMFLMLVLIAGCRYIVFYNEQEIRISKVLGGYRMICCSDIHSVYLGSETITIYELKTHHIPSWFAQGSPFITFLQKYVKTDKTKNWRHMPRALKDSVYDPSSVVGGSLIMSVLGCVVIFMGLLVPELQEYFSVLLVFGLIIIGWMPLMIVSVKRAHLSAFWDTIARLSVQEVALIPAIFSPDTVLAHLGKGRTVILLYQQQRYIIMPGDFSPVGRKYTLVKITENREEIIFDGKGQELLAYEFASGVSFLSQIEAFDFLYIFKKARIVKE